jgi:hypothetical protein
MARAAKSTRPTYLQQMARLGMRSNLPEAVWLFTGSFFVKTEEFRFATQPYFFLAVAPSNAFPRTPIFRL